MAVDAGPGLLAFLIADVRGYTSFTVQRGDEAAAILATEFARITSRVIEESQGRVVELRGDEVLAVFSSARQALRAAVALQSALAAAAREDLPLRVGVGIDAGEAVPVDGGYRGAALNLAARLCSLAGPGEVLASETVINLARKVDGLQYIDRGTADLKGFTSRVAVMQVVPDEPAVESAQSEETPEEQRFPIGGFLGALPANQMVARASELETILISLRAALEGNGRLVFLAGEPGVGKTRLAQEVTLKARNSGFLVAGGRCYEPEEGVPYYPFREALTTLYEVASPDVRASVTRLWPYVLQLLPGATTRVPPATGSSGEEQQNLFYAVTSFLAGVAAVQPVALLLDDLHWADQSSLRLLQYIARHTRSDRIFVLGTYRDVEVGRHHPLERALRDLHREGLSDELAVRRLDRAAIAALTAASFGGTEVSEEFAALLYRHTEGNPFFAHEVLNTLVERGDVFLRDGRWDRRDLADIQVPKSVRSTVGERVSRLPTQAQEILAEASVLGQTFQFDDLQALSGCDERVIEEALDEAEGAGLVRRGEKDTYSFNHALTQQVLYEELPARRRRRLHLAAGGAIERGRPPDHRIPDLAWHFLQGDDSQRALVYSIRAGDAAESVAAHAEAKKYYLTSVELARDLGDRRGEMTALEKLGTVLCATGPFDEAAGALVAADRLAIEHGDREVQRRTVAQWLQLVGLHRQSEADAHRRLEELIRDTEPSQGLGDLYLTLSRLAFASGRYGESREWAEKTAEVARALGSDYLLAGALMRLGTTLSTTHDVARTAVLEQAILLAERSSNWSALGTALNNLAFLYMMQGKLRTNLQYRQRALQEAVRRQDPAGMVMGRAMVAQAHTYLGELATAEDHAEVALHAVRRMERIWHTTYALYIAAHVRILKGEWEEGRALLRDGKDMAREYHDVQGMGYGRAIGGELSLLRDEPEAVIASYESVEPGDIVGWERWVAAEAYRRVGRHDVTARIAQTMMADFDWYWAEGLRVRGACATDYGDIDAAERDLTAALGLVRRQEYRLEEIRILFEMARLQVRRGDCAGRLARLEETHRLCREVGAYAYAQLAERVMTQSPDPG